MTIYTRIGDEGDTTRTGGPKIRKSDPLCHAVGDLDELNACLGWCIAQARADQAGPILAALEPLQAELLTLGAMVAASGSAPAPAEITAQSVARMEGLIDQAMNSLPPLAHFVLPGGRELSCRLHIARTVCRRAERHIVAAVDAGLNLPAPALKYINRLSDLLFVLARMGNEIVIDPDGR